MPQMNITFATLKVGLRQAWPGVALAMGLLLVIASLIVVLFFFDNFTMNLLDPFSVICMAKSDVTVTTICHKAAVHSFHFARRC